MSDGIRCSAPAFCAPPADARSSKAENLCSSEHLCIATQAPPAGLEAGPTVPSRSGTSGDERNDALSWLRGATILFLSEARAFGGHEQMAVRAAALLSRHAKLTFRFFAGNERLRAAIEAENRNGAQVGIAVSQVHDARLNPMLSPLRWSRIAAARRDLRSGAWTVRVLVQGRIESGCVALLAARLGGVRLVSYVPMAHRLVEMRVSFLPRLRDALNVLYYRLPAGYVTISEGTRRQLLRFAPRACVRVVENWVEAPSPLATGTPLAGLRARWGVPEGTKVVGMIGRVDFQQKGHDALLRALASEAGRVSDFVVCVVGDGIDLPRLRQLVDAAGLARRFVFEPWVSASMDAVYRSLDAVALPSRYEGVPLVMLEALARRIPVAGSDVDGMAEWLPAAATAPLDDCAALLRAVRFACEGHPDAYAACYARAQLRTEENAYASAWAAALADLAPCVPA